MCFFSPHEAATTIAKEDIRLIKKIHSEAFIPVKIRHRHQSNLADLTRAGLFHFNRSKCESKRAVNNGIRKNLHTAGEGKKKRVKNFPLVIFSARQPLRLIRQQGQRERERER